MINYVKSFLHIADRPCDIPWKNTCLHVDVAEDTKDTEDQHHRFTNTNLHETNLRGIYLKACESLNIQPITYFCQHLTDSTVHMKHHMLGSEGVKACAIALVVGTHFLYFFLPLLIDNIILNMKMIRRGLIPVFFCIDKDYFAFNPTVCVIDAIYLTWLTFDID